MEIKEQFKLSGFYEISVNTGENVEKVFREMTKMILHNLNID